MKAIWVMVATINGRTTKGDDPDIYSWTSKEDSKFFFELLSKNKLIVMGSNTYKAVKNVIKLDSKRLRVVLTRNPEKYLKEEVKDKLRFSSETPQELVKRASSEGYKTLLLVSGSSLGTAFLKAGLIDELYLTIEPKIFGTGNPLILGENIDVSLKLLEMTRLNKAGTILLKYKVQK